MRKEKGGGAEDSDGDEAGAKWRARRKDRKAGVQEKAGWRGGEGLVGTGGMVRAGEGTGGGWRGRGEGKEGQRGKWEG